MTRTYVVQEVWKKVKSPLWELIWCMAHQIK